MNKIVILILSILLGVSLYISQEKQGLQASVPVSPINGQWMTTKVEVLPNVLIMQLTYNGPDTWYISPNNPISKYLTLEFRADSHNEFTLKIFDRENNQRFNLPYQKPFPFNKASDPLPTPSEFQYEHSAVNAPFYFLVWRASTPTDPIFDSTKQNFMYSDKFMEISTSVNNNFVYGFGERRQRFRFKSGSYSFWAKDAAAHNEDGRPDGQLYGSHPMYLKREKNGQFHIGFMRNAGGMLVQYLESERITYRLTGGIIEFKYFLGDNKPENVVQMYHAYVNGVSLHPFWAQGFHQCRYGYRNSDELLTVWNKYNENNLPFDTLWSDIDYMTSYWDFSIDTNRFKIADMQKFTNLENKLGVHWVPIIDAGISVNQPGAKRGKELNVFIKSTQHSGDDLVGCVWPQNTYFTDFNSPNAQKFWTEGLKNISANYNVVPSGIWIDMNEYANFVQGETTVDGNCPTFSPIGEFEIPENNNQFLKQTEEEQVSVSNGFEVPYNPTGGHALDEQTLSLDAYHYCGKDSPFIQCDTNRNLREFDYHNINGFGEGVATHNALLEMGNPLPFIISRSTLFGSGAYVQHWTGDNQSTWNDMYLSVSEIFNFGLFGIPFVGADICGFLGNTNPELCARWMQLGALYPFARNHNTINVNSQEPYAFPNEPYVLQSSRKSLQLRYSLLKHYYSLFIANNGSGTVFRPLFFEFPNDEKLYDIDWEFMVGEALLAAPALVQGNNQVTNIQITFPQAETFFDYYNGQSYSGVYQTTIDVPFSSTVPLFLRAGTLVATQDVSTVLRSRDLTNKFNLKIGLERETQDNFVSEGLISSLSDYSEQNVVQKCISGNNCVVKISVKASVNGNKLIVNIFFEGQTAQTNFETIIIDSVEIYGFQDFTGQFSNDIKKFFVYNENVITGSGQELNLEVTL